MNQHKYARDKIYDWKLFICSIHQLCLSMLSTGTVENKIRMIRCFLIMMHDVAFKNVSGFISTYLWHMEKDKDIHCLH